MDTRTVFEVDCSGVITECGFKCPKCIEEIQSTLTATPGVSKAHIDKSGEEQKLVVERDGTMFGLVADDVMHLKVDDANREDFVKAGSAPFNPYPQKAKKTTVVSYYEIPADIPIRFADSIVGCMKVGVTNFPGAQFG